MSHSFFFRIPRTVEVFVAHQPAVSYTKFFTAERNGPDLSMWFGRLNVIVSSIRKPRVAKGLVTE